MYAGAFNTGRVARSSLRIPKEVAVPYVFGGYGWKAHTAEETG